MAKITIASAVHHPSIMRELSELCGTQDGGATRDQAYRRLREELPLRQLRDWTVGDLVAHYLVEDSAGRYQYRAGMGGARGVSPEPIVSTSVRTHDGSHWPR